MADLGPVAKDGRLQLQLPADEVEAALAAPTGDPPAGIGEPATRALLGAGLTTPERVARHAEPELLALHGAGPKAVRILTETPHARGLALRD
ncbi:hypothetical protein [Streptomyces noursei]|uniref:hypothetical protein n=1 Tax=Streptomyces noursei TaxID=1971 RepID=UPI0019C0F247|nr:hypothetical protein [Streptomyces noursei]MCZ1013221.1 hypothetical protein [Streptomyces noursei]GGX27882.1 hypothetical protein GCM10010341_56830 [Streptomyces noursei]